MIEKTSNPDPKALYEAAYMADPLTRCGKVIPWEELTPHSQRPVRARVDAVVQALEKAQEVSDASGRERERPSEPRTCKGCGAVWSLLSSPTEPEPLKLACPHCGTLAVYEGGSVVEAFEELAAIAGPGWDPGSAARAVDVARSEEPPAEELRQAIIEAAIDWHIDAIEVGRLQHLVEQVAEVPEEQVTAADVEQAEEQCQDSEARLDGAVFRYIDAYPAAMDRTKS